MGAPRAPGAEEERMVEAKGLGAGEVLPLPPPFPRPPSWRSRTRSKGRVHFPFGLNSVMISLCLSILSCDRPGRNARGLQRRHHADCRRENQLCRHSLDRLNASMIKPKKIFVAPISFQSLHFYTLPKFPHLTPGLSHLCCGCLLLSNLWRGLSFVYRFRRWRFPP